MSTFYGDSIVKTTKALLKKLLQQLQQLDNSLYDFTLSEATVVVFIYQLH